MTFNQNGQPFDGRLADSYTPSRYYFKDQRSGMFFVIVSFFIVVLLFIH